MKCAILDANRLDVFLDVLSARVAGPRKCSATRLLFAPSLIAVLGWQVDANSQIGIP
jgi:hypothetical protein